MAVAAPRRLPGIAFDAVAPPSPDVLPRMDVAAFVGFASAGPLDVPVAVEDPGQFAAIFGGDLALGWDARRSVRVRAHLGPCVRAFFRSGGRRAWVVRVAGRGAERASVPVPGLATLGPAGIEPARLRARSRGAALAAWRAGSALLSTGARITASSPMTLELALPPGARLVPGDLVRVGGELMFAAAAVRAVGPGLVKVTAQADAQAVLAVEGGAPAGSSGSVRLLGPAGDAPPAPAVVVASPRGIALGVEAPASDAPQPGALIRFAPASGDELWIAVDEVRAGRAGDTSPDAGFWLSGRAWSVEVIEPEALALPGAGRAEVLRLELVARAPDGTLTSLADLGFAPGQPRWVGDLPIDEDLYRASAAAVAGERPLPPLWVDASAPRFALAGPDAPPALTFPLGMEAVPRHLLAAPPSDVPDVEREGLAEVDDALFLERGLRAARVENLAGEAQAIRDAAPGRRSLHGLHAVLGLDEVTLLAVPDAAQRGWSLAPVEAPPEPAYSEPAEHPEAGVFVGCDRRVLATPELSEPELGADGAIRLSWTATDEPGAAYELQETGAADGWDGAETLVDGPQQAMELYGRRAGAWHYRVRARKGPNLSDWSAPRTAVVDPPPRYDVDQPGGTAATATLLAVQRAMLRLAAARGDVLCVLSLPEGAREDDAREHLARLAGRHPDPDPVVALPPELDPVPALDPSEHAALSYGAAYHPWPVVPAGDAAGAYASVPPDGVATGSIAARAIARGAWVAPANQALPDVVELTPALTRAAAERLREVQLNPLLQEPAGFVAVAADTLSVDADLRPLGVRRLMSLLRRVALLHGPGYAFEPNSGAVHRAIERRFGELLTRLHVLGAFAGATPEQAYQVRTVVDDRDLDAGRLVVELKVAPSRPLVFLTVRLVQTGDGTRVEGA